MFIVSVCIANGLDEFAEQIKINLFASKKLKMQQKSKRTGMQRKAGKNLLLQLSIKMKTQKKHMEKP